MLTEDKIIRIYCIIDDILKGIGHKEDLRRRVSDSEVITTALVSALYFGGHLDNDRGFMKMTKLIPAMLDKSRFNRRLHQVSELVFSLFFQLGHQLKSMAGASEYVIDSFPVAVCDNIRISRCKLLKGKQWRGKQSSMRRYFYGVKVQVLVNACGIPVEFGFVPGCESDVQALKKLPLSVVAAATGLFGQIYIKLKKGTSPISILCRGIILLVSTPCTYRKTISFTLFLPATVINGAKYFFIFQ